MSSIRRRLLHEVTLDSPTVPLPLRSTRLD